MIPATFRRLLSRGDLPESDGGLYNPGAWYDAVNDQVYMTVRHEEDYTWTKPCRATWLQANVTPLVRRTLPVMGYHAGTRFEDLRPFVFDDQVLVAHVAYRPHSGEPVYQRISQLCDNRLERWDDWRLPVTPQPIEKNWVLAARDTDLFTIYSLDPLLVFKRAADRWEPFHVEVTGLTKAFGKPLRNSTHLLPFDGGFLGFWHFILDRQYVHGAYWLDADFRFRARTGILLDSDWVTQDVSGGVYKPGVLYISSAIQRGEDVLLFYGEGDAHAGVATIQVSDLRARLQ